MTIRAAVLILSLGTIAVNLHAQAPTAEQHPDAPSASLPAMPAVNSVLVLRTVYASTPTRPSRQSSLPDAPSYTALSDEQKFGIFVESSYSTLTFFSAGVNAGAAHIRGDHAYGTGVLGFGRSYGAALATKESNAFFGRYLFPALLNQDPRYHPSLKSGLMPRATHAASRVLFTQNDKGQTTLNTSYLLSTVTSSTLANAYKPPAYRSFGNTASDILTTIGGEAGMNILREFWPQLREGLGRIEPKPIRKLRVKFNEDQGVLPR
ncbi:MAG TPA: hypothetical protein VN622_17045 [Clostridia bacterium]|nr:hypothetical protein [Clostridia bacterium]